MSTDPMSSSDAADGLNQERPAVVQAVVLNAVSASEGECGVITQAGRPCPWLAPCGVHDEEWHRKRERRAVATEDARMKRETRTMTAEDRKCGWITGRGHPCTYPMPCSIHAAKRAREQRAEEAKARALLPKCGKRRRDDTVCDRPKPCQIHELALGKRWCSSTLDGNPTERCQLQTDIGEMFCDKHREFPDLGRKAAIFYQMCGGENVEVTAFLAWAYPHTEQSPDIYNFPLFAESAYKKMTSL